jgi:ATP-dependent RNA helicase DDX5/DBP2
LFNWFNIVPPIVEMTNSTEDHVHRIGRTGRAGHSGEAFTFLSRSGEDTWKAAGIVEIMNKAGQDAPPEVNKWF